MHLLLHCLPVIRMLVEVVGYLNGVSFGVRGNVSNFTEKWVPYVQNRCGCHNLLHIPCIRKHFFLFFFFFFLSDGGVLCNGIEKLRC